jgi:hypothetical protein
MGLFSGVLKIVPLFIFVRSAGCKINSLFCEPSADFACARANPYLDEYLSCWMNNDNNKTANTAEARPANRAPPRCSARPTRRLIHSASHRPPAGDRNTAPRVGARFVASAVSVVSD